MKMSVYSGRPDNAILASADGAPDSETESENVDLELDRTLAIVVGKVVASHLPRIVSSTVKRVCRSRIANRNSNNTIYTSGIACSEVDGAADDDANLVIMMDDDEESPPELGNSNSEELQEDEELELVPDPVPTTSQPQENLPQSSVDNVNVNNEEDRPGRENPHRQSNLHSRVRPPGRQAPNTRPPVMDYGLPDDVRDFDGPDVFDLGVPFAQGSLVDQEDPLLRTQMIVVTPPAVFAPLFLPADESQAPVSSSVDEIQANPQLPGVSVSTQATSEQPVSRNFPRSFRQNQRPGDENMVDNFLNDIPGPSSTENHAEEVDRKRLAENVDQNDTSGPSSHSPNMYTSDLSSTGHGPLGLTNDDTTAESLETTSISVGDENLANYVRSSLASTAKPRKVAGDGVAVTAINLSNAWQRDQTTEMPRGQGADPPQEDTNAVPVEQNSHTKSCTSSDSSSDSVHNDEEMLAIAENDFINLPIRESPGPIISQWDRTDEDADALLEQVISGRGDKNLGPNIAPILAGRNSSLDGKSVFADASYQFVSLRNANSAAQETEVYTNELTPVNRGDVIQTEEHSEVQSEQTNAGKLYEITREHCSGDVSSFSLSPRAVVSRTDIQEASEISIRSSRSDNIYSSTTDTEGDMQANARSCSNESVNGGEKFSKILISESFNSKDNTEECDHEIPKIVTQLEQSDFSDGRGFVSDVSSTDLRNNLDEEDSIEEKYRDTCSQEDLAPESITIYSPPSEKLIDVTPGDEIGVVGTLAVDGAEQNCFKEVSDAEKVSLFNESERDTCDLVSPRSDITGDIRAVSSEVILIDVTSSPGAAYFKRKNMTDSTTNIHTDTNISQANALTASLPSATSVKSAIGSSPPITGIQPSDLKSNLLHAVAMSFGTYTSLSEAGPSRNLYDSPAYARAEMEDIHGEIDMDNLHREVRIQNLHTPVGIENLHPAGIEKIHTPIGIDNLHTPVGIENLHLVGIEKIHSPIGIENLHTPVGIENLHTPVGIEDLHTPVGIEDLHTPVGTENLHTPVGIEDLHTPVGIEDLHTPVGIENLHTEVKMAIKHTEVEMENVRTQVEIETHKMLESAGDYIHKKDHISQTKESMEIESVSLSASDSGCFRDEKDMTQITEIESIHPKESQLINPDTESSKDSRVQDLFVQISCHAHANDRIALPNEHNENDFSEVKRASSHDWYDTKTNIENESMHIINIEDKHNAGAMFQDSTSGIMEENIPPQRNVCDDENAENSKLSLKFYSSNGNVSSASSSSELSHEDCMGETVGYTLETVDCKDETVDCKDETVDCNDETVDCKQETVDCKQETVDCNDETVECKEETVECDRRPEVLCSEVNVDKIIVTSDASQASVAYNQELYVPNENFSQNVQNEVVVNEGLEVTACQNDVCSKDMECISDKESDREDGLFVVTRDVFSPWETDNEDKISDIVSDSADNEYEDDGGDDDDDHENECEEDGKEGNNETTTIREFTIGDGDVDIRCGDVDRRCGDVDRRCGDVDRRCGDVDRRCGDVDRRCGDVDKQIQQLPNSVTNNDKTEIDYTRNWSETCPAPLTFKQDEEPVGIVKARDEDNAFEISVQKVAQNNEEFTSSCSDLRPETASQFRGTQDKTLQTQTGESSAHATNAGLLAESGVTSGNVNDALLCDLSGESKLDPETSSCDAFPECADRDFQVPFEKINICLIPVDDRVEDSGDKTGKPLTSSFSSTNSAESHIELHENHSPTSAGSNVSQNRNGIIVCETLPKLNQRGSVSPSENISQRPSSGNLSRGMNVITSVMARNEAASVDDGSRNQTAPKGSWSKAEVSLENYVDEIAATDSVSDLSDLASRNSDVALDVASDIRQTISISGCSTTSDGGGYQCAARSSFHSVKSSRQDIYPAAKIILDATDAWLNKIKDICRSPDFLTSEPNDQQIHNLAAQCKSEILAISQLPEVLDRIPSPAKSWTPHYKSGYNGRSNNRKDTTCSDEKMTTVIDYKNIASCDSEQAIKESRVLSPRPPSCGRRRPVNIQRRKARADVTVNSSLPTDRLRPLDTNLSRPGSRQSDKTVSEVSSLQKQVSGSTEPRLDINLPLSSLRKISSRKTNPQRHEGTKNDIPVHVNNVKEIKSPLTNTSATRKLPDSQAKQGLCSYRDFRAARSSSTGIKTGTGDRSFCPASSDRYWEFQRSRYISGNQKEPRSVSASKVQDSSVPLQICPSNNASTGRKDRQQSMTIQMESSHKTCILTRPPCPGKAGQDGASRGNKDEVWRTRYFRSRTAVINNICSPGQPGADKETATKAESSTTQSLSRLTIEPVTIKSSGKTKTYKMLTMQEFERIQEDKHLSQAFSRINSSRAYVDCHLESKYMERQGPCIKRHRERVNYNCLIALENIKFLEMLRYKKSSYDKDDQLKDFKKSYQKMIQMSKHPEQLTEHKLLDNQSGRRKIDTGRCQMKSTQGQA